MPLLILNYHLEHSHAGIQTLTSTIREQYWNISSRHSIQTALNKCIQCKKFKAKAPSTASIQLSLDRVGDAEIFEIINLCSPLVLRNKIKSWVVLFTCAVYWQ